MTLFKTSGELKAEVASLTADLESANSEIASLQTQLGEVQADLATARESLLSVPTADQVAKLEADLATAEAAATPKVIEAKAVELASAENPPEAIQKVIASRVTEELAGAGHDKPIADTGTDAGAKTITRSEFNAMSPYQKATHFRAGGKLSD